MSALANTSGPSIVTVPAVYPCSCNASFPAIIPNGKAHDSQHAIPGFLQVQERDSNHLTGEKAAQQQLFGQIVW